MKFIFPKNYKFRFKLLGFIDYKTAIFDSVYGLLLFFFTNLIFNSISMKIYCFVSLFFPIILFSIFGVNEENIIDIIIYLFKFSKSQKIILYDRK